MEHLGLPEPWTVPVCQPCHQRWIDRWASRAAHDFLTNAMSMEAKDLRTLADVAWERGSLGRSCYTRELVRKKRLPGQSTREDRSLEINAASGTRDWARRLRPQVTGDRCDHGPAELLSCAMLLLNLGESREGQKFVVGAKDMIGTRRHGRWTDLRAMCARREILLSPSERAAKETVSLARQHQDFVYGIRTSLILSGWTWLGLNKPSRARDDFEEVTLCGQGPVSWWHLYESRFGLACALYLQEKDWQAAARHLQAAQYIMVMLNLRGVPRPDVSCVGHTMKADLFPSDILDWIVDRHGRQVTKDRMLELRWEAIKPRIRNEILDSL